jgi:tRNA threonylcarbamoyladenosine biosynthesis protein TsaB
MILLAIDTSGQKGGVLLARSALAVQSSSIHRDTAEILGTATLQPREFSRELLAGVEDVLRMGQIRLADLDCIAVVAGPGSFTGLRVGLSAVKALAEAMGTPVVALSTLAILASKAARASDDEAGSVVHAVMDAGRGEFYHGMYRDAGTTCVHESVNTLSALMESMRAAPGRLAVLNFSSADVLAGLQPELVENLRVEDVVPLALAAWQRHQFADVAVLDANYLRSIQPAIRGVMG